MNNENLGLLNSGDFSLKINEVLQFAIKNIKRIQNQSKKDDEIYVANVKWSDKIIAETLLLLLLLSRNKNTQKLFESEIDLLCNLIIPLSRSSFYKMEILKSPKLLLPFGFSHIVLNKLGYFDSDFDHIIQNAISSNKINVSERITFREMDLRWGLFLFDENVGLNLECILELSILKKNICVMDMSREDEYAYTHSIFYCTDFGELDLPDSIDRSTVNDIINGCLAKNILIEDLDLLGEFLICSILTQNTNSIFFKIGLEYLIKMWNDLGFLPSPSFNKAEYLKLNDQEATSYIFKNIYHTYYIGGILCILLLNNSGRRHNKEKDISVFSIHHISLDDLIVKLDLLSLSAFRFCKENFKTEVLSACEVSNRIKNQESLLQKINSYLIKYEHLLLLLPKYGLENSEFKKFVFDTLLIQSVRDHDLPFLCDLLLDIIDSQILPTHIFIESVNYLIRQQLQSGSMTGFFFMNTTASINTRCMFEFKMAFCLSEIASYLKSYRT